jgi:hypothetical protein
MKMNNVAPAIAILAMGFASAANATIMQLSSPAQISTSYLNTFESGINSGPVTFGASASLMPASSAAGGVTPSGTQGLWLVPTPLTAPLVATLSSKYNAIGLIFGNDDFGLVFDAILTVYDGAANLGSVIVTSNANDFADQFIGLSSTVAFDRVEISYERPEAQSLGIYLDDFRLGAPATVPEPASLALLGVGFAGLAAMRRRKTA